MNKIPINSLTHQQCDDAFIGLELKEKQWLFTILAELKSARRKHPAWPLDVVHRAAIVGEEAGELIQAALQAFHESGMWELMHKEAVQTASTCLRFLAETSPFRDIHERAAQQAACTHAYQVTGEGHNKQYYRCNKCGHETKD